MAPDRRRWRRSQHPTGDDTGGWHPTGDDGAHHPTGDDTGGWHPTGDDGTHHPTGDDTGALASDRRRHRRWHPTGDDGTHHPTGDDTGGWHPTGDDGTHHPTGDDTGGWHPTGDDGTHHPTGDDTGGWHPTGDDGTHHPTGDDTAGWHPTGDDSTHHPTGDDTAGWHPTGDDGPHQPTEHPDTHHPAEGPHHDPATPRLGGSWPYSEPVPNREELGTNVQKDHPIATSKIDLMVRDPSGDSPYDPRQVETLLVETGKGTDTTPPLPHTQKTFHDPQADVPELQRLRADGIGHFADDIVEPSFNAMVRSGYEPLAAGRAILDTLHYLFTLRSPSEARADLERWGTGGDEVTDESIDRAFGE